MYLLIAHWHVGVPSPLFCGNALWECFWFRAGVVERDRKRFHFGSLSLVREARWRLCYTLASGSACWCHCTFVVCGYMSKMHVQRVSQLLLVCCSSIRFLLLCVFPLRLPGFVWRFRVEESKTNLFQVYTRGFVDIWAMSSPSSSGRVLLTALCRVSLDVVFVRGGSGREVRLPFALSLHTRVLRSSPVCLTFFGDWGLGDGSTSESSGWRSHHSVLRSTRGSSVFGT